ncbi:MAG: hypothetical protein K5945_00755 [Bacteroidaceae bacterium]|nr:hypothetical protein [Bacteroidaceae bacterium]
MSDGNFNRALLPATPYRSGVKMGQQQMKARAMETFETLLKERFPMLTDEELHDLVETFRQRLSSVAP